MQDAAYSSVFSMPWYLDAVSPGWCGLMWNDYQAVMPVSIQKKGRVGYVYQPLFSRVSPVCGDSALDATVFLEFLKKRFKLVHIGWPYAQGPVGFRSSTSIYQTLSLNRDYATIVAGYSSNTRRMLKKLEKETVAYGRVDPDELIGLFRQEKGQQFVHLDDAAYCRLETLMRNAQQAHAGEPVALRQNGRLLAAGFFIRFGNELLFLKGAVSDEGKRCGAMFGVFDFMIRKYAEVLDVLDFGGSRNEGLATFNKKFGAHDTNYVFLTHNAFPWPLNRLADRKLKQ